MKVKTLAIRNTAIKRRKIRGITVLSLIVGFIFLSGTNLKAATKTSTGTGNWSDSGTWSPAGRPDDGDDVIIRSGDVVTIDSNFICNNLTIGNSTSADATLQITSAANSLTINGDLQINPDTKSKAFVLNAGPGSIHVAGTFSVWNYGIGSSSSGIRVGSGSITFTPAITITSFRQDLMFTDAGTITFNAGFTDQANELTTFAGCTVNFKSTYTVNTSAANWGGKGTAVFWNGSSIIPTAGITFNNVETYPSASVTLNSGSGAVIVAGSLTLASGSTFTTNKDFEVAGDWINNNGTFTGTNDTLTLNGSSGSIGGTHASTFRVLRIGRNAGSTAVSYTANSDITCDYLRLSAGSAARTLSLASGKTLAISSDVMISQPTATSITASLSVNSGTCNVSGNLTFQGTNNTTSRIAQVAVTSGTFNLTGTVTWMTNTAVATEVITVSTGTLTFGTSVTMGSGSGTMEVNGTGIINFNGATVPSLNFGGATGPVLITSSGCSVNFEKGFANTTTDITFATGSYINIGSSTSVYDLTIDPGTTVTNNGTTVIYGALTSSSAATFVNGTNATLEIKGTISANVTLTATATGNTVKYNGGSAQTVKPTAYYNLTLDSADVKSCASGISVNNDLAVRGAATISNSAALTVTDNFIYSSSASSTLGNSITASGVTLSAGTLDDGGNTITINNSNGWNYNGGTFTTIGTVAFTGTAASVIAGSLSTKFNNLIINNSGGVTLSVSPASATEVSGALNLTNGVLHTTASNILRLLDGATSGSGSAASYVDGPMVKVGNDDFTFPTGKAGKWMRVAALGMTTPTTEVTAEYFPTPYTDTTSLMGSLTQVSHVEYWDVNRTVTTDPVKLKLFWEDLSASTIINCDFLTIAHYKDGSWQEEPSTFTGTFCTGNASGSITMNGYVNSFSPFSFGGSGGQALPIQLVSFDAVANGNMVQTSWITSLEINNDYFTVERSTDGNNFTEVGRITGAGNSTVINTYQLVDENACKGTSYYRLRQTDFDGHYTYSNKVAVRIAEQVGAVKLFPNPVQNRFYISVSNPAENIELKVFDMLGKQVYQKTYTVNEESTSQTVSVATSDILPSGIYLVNVSSNGTEFKEKLIVK